MTMNVSVAGVRRPTRGVYRWLDAGAEAVIRVTLVAGVLIVAAAGLLVLLVLVAAFF